MVKKNNIQERNSLKKFKYFLKNKELEKKDVNWNSSKEKWIFNYQ